MRTSQLAFLINYLRSKEILEKSLKKIELSVLSNTLETWHLAYNTVL